MGWASGGDIFNGVAKALVDLNADRRTVLAVLEPLIDKLRDGDWDTVDESIEEFSGHPLIVEALVKAVGTEVDGDGAVGLIDIGSTGWVLDCSEHNVLGFGDDTAGTHDRLVRLWAKHEQEHHGGDGTVDPRYLIDPEAVSR